MHDMNGKRARVGALNRAAGVESNLHEITGVVVKRRKDRREWIDPTASQNGHQSIRRSSSVFGEMCAR